MQTRFPSILSRAFLAALLACAGCAPEGDDASRAEQAPAAAVDARYVGGGVCAECHAEQARRWRGSHHDLAMQSASAASVLGDFDGARFEHAGVTSVFRQRGGEFTVSTDGPDGTLQEFRVAYTFGVEPLQQYLAELPGGRLQALPIAWDTRPAAAGGQRWFHLNPGARVDHEDPLHWTRTAMSWNSSCAACHSTGLVKGYSAARDEFATDWASIDVDCEACHGPGSLHASAPTEQPLHLGPDPRTWVFVPDDPIAERRPAARADGDAENPELEVCAQCHSRRAQITETFAAGDALLDAFVPALLEPDLYHADGQIRGEVFELGSFAQSAMHAAGVTCSDCHDPHSARLRAEGNALCAGCHAANVYDTPSHHRHDAGGAGTACVDCHMRTETYMVVDPRHDHSFRVPRPDLSAALGTPNACNDCHAERSAAWAAARVAEWYPDGANGDFHYGRAIHAGREWTADRVPLLTRVFDDPESPVIARATAVRLIAEHPDAAALGVIERALADREPRVQLAALESLGAVPEAARAGMAQRFLTHPLRALRITAAAALAGARETLSERRKADLDAALDEYVAVQAFDADRAEGQLNRASVFVSAGRLDEAEAALLSAIEREPGFPPAYVNLADLYRLTGREQEAQRTLERGLEANPDAPALHYALGLSLVRGGRLDAALEALRRAADGAADEPRYAYAYAIALNSADPEQALEVLGAAARRFPGHPPTLFALATLHRDRGDVPAALRYTEQLLGVSPADAGGRALKAQLEAAAASAR
ncbi:MAG: tetratricopeptide repeat protein [Gammaproteobacteria bacterium]|nr:tetratricopeptide repeat protein [Gammaproteobacteria bacterium]